MEFLDFIPGTSKWLFLIAVAAFYGIGWVAWRVQNDCLNRGYGPVATTFWSVGTLFLFFPVFPLYLFLRERLGIKPGALIEQLAHDGPEVPSLLCGSCGTMNPAYVEECLSCGKPMVGADERKVGVGTVSCPVCGNPNVVGTQVCESCGHYL